MSAPATTDGLPKVAVIITAFNYEKYIEGAIRSILDQTHQDFEIVVVDDHSATASSMRTKHIVETFKDPRITLWRNESNIGQTHSFYAGLDKTSAEFVCLLDPDDRYLPGFLEHMLTAHLNPIHIAPLAFANQQYMRGMTRLSGSYGTLLLKHFAGDSLDGLEASLDRFGFSSFIASDVGGWIWTSTSSMMFRRDALEMIRPGKRLAYKAFADTYLANGAHLLGGTLFVHKVLTSRTLHDQNDFRHARIFSTNQRWGTLNWMGGKPKRDAAESLFANGSAKLMRKKELRGALLARLSLPELFYLWRNSRAFRASMGNLILMRSLLRWIKGSRTSVLQ